MGEPSAANPVPKTPQQCVYAAAASMSELRCGDLVDVEWEQEWYPGMVTDVPTPDELAVSYTNGDFEDSVPKTVARLRKIPPRKRPGDDQKKGKKLDSTVKLRNAANEGDIGLVMEALKEGGDARAQDELGYSALHWAAGPDEGMPGDTIARRACIALLARVGDRDASDGTALGLRAVQHSVVRNLVGCVKTFHHKGADMRGTLHWAMSCKAHGALRELLRLGVKANSNKNEWDGCSPLMLAASANDAYGIQLLVEHTRRTQGESAIRGMLSETQHGKLRSTALHYAADSAADGVVEALLALGANPTTRSARGETAAVLARKRAAAAEKGATTEIHEAALRCASLIEAAAEREKERRRSAHQEGIAARHAKGTRKGKQLAEGGAMPPPPMPGASAAGPPVDEADDDYDIDRMDDSEADPAAGTDTGAEFTDGGGYTSHGGGYASGATREDGGHTDSGWYSEAASEASPDLRVGASVPRWAQEEELPPVDYAIDAAAAATVSTAIFGQAVKPEPASDDGAPEDVEGSPGDGRTLGVYATPATTLRMTAAAIRAAAIQQMEVEEQLSGGGTGAAAPTADDDIGSRPAATSSAVAGGGSAAGAAGVAPLTMKLEVRETEEAEVAQITAVTEEWEVYVMAACTALWAVDGADAIEVVKRTGEEEEEEEEGDEEGEAAGEEEAAAEEAAAAQEPEQANQAADRAVDEEDDGGMGDADDVMLITGGLPLPEADEGGERDDDQDVVMLPV